MALITGLIAVAVAAAAAESGSDPFAAQTHTQSGSSRHQHQHDPDRNQLCLSRPEIGRRRLRWQRCSQQLEVAAYVRLLPLGTTLLELSALRMQPV